MKKSIIYLLSLIFIVALASACDPPEYNNTSDVVIVSEQNNVNVEMLADDVLLEYEVVDRFSGLKITFKNEVSYDVTGIMYLKDIRTSEYERHAAFCSAELYDKLEAPEKIYEKSTDFISYCKKARDGTLYHKAFILNNPGKS